MQELDDGQIGAADHAVHFQPGAKPIGMVLAQRLASSRQRIGARLIAAEDAGGHEVTKHAIEHIGVGIRQLGQVPCVRRSPAM